MRSGDSKLAASNEHREALLIVQRIALDGSDVRKVPAFGLAVIENGTTAKTQQNAFSACAFASGVLIFPHHWRQDEDAFFSFTDMASQFVPRMEPRNVRRCGFLQRNEHHVVQAECEFPDYVNWRKKAMVTCIFLRSRVNIVRTISRTLAICALTWLVDYFRLASLERNAARPPLAVTTKPIFHRLFGCCGRFLPSGRFPSGELDDFSEGQAH